MENYENDYFPYIVTKDAQGYSLIDYRSGKTIVKGMAGIDDMWKRYGGHILIIYDQENKIMIYDLIKEKFLIDQGITINSDNESWVIYDDELVFDDIYTDPYMLAMLDEGTIVIRDRKSRVCIYQ